METFKPGATVRITGVALPTDMALFNETIGARGTIMECDRKDEGESRYIVEIHPDDAAAARKHQRLSVCQLPMTYRYRGSELTIWQETCASDLAAELARIEREATHGPLFIGGM